MNNQRFSLSEPAVKIMHHTEYCDTCRHDAKLATTIGINAYDFLMYVVEPCPRGMKTKHD